MHDTHILLTGDGLATPESSDSGYEYPKEYKAMLK